jgi:hypothetical protein
MNVGIYNFRKELIEILISTSIKSSSPCPYGKKVELLKSMGAEYHPIEITDGERIL